MTEIRLEIFSIYDVKKGTAETCVLYWNNVPP